jgi:endonuclease III
MRTSRIARETVKFRSRESHNSNPNRRPQTRSFAANLQTFTATEKLCQETAVLNPEHTTDDESSLSSRGSASVLDIEDFTSPAISTQKRKREPDGSSTYSTSVTTQPGIRASPRKSDFDIKNGPASKPKKARRQPAKGVLNGTGEVEIHPPANWEEIYETVREMRKSILAPVDTMGCESLAEEHISPRVRVSSIHFVIDHPLMLIRSSASRH